MSKKTFKHSINPAMQFISTPIKEQHIPQSPPTPAKQQSPVQSSPTTDLVCTPKETPDGHNVKSAYVETKSKRLQLLLQPSVYQKLKQKALADGKSVNATVNAILQEALKKG